MNEKALQTLYGLAQKEGYSKSYNEFISLMSSNQDAVSNMYSLSQKNGYTKSIDDFSVLVGFSGVKKKEDTEPSLGEELLSEKKKKAMEQGYSSSDIDLAEWVSEQEKAAPPKQSIAKVREASTERMPDKKRPKEAPKQVSSKDFMPSTEQPTDWQQQDQPFKSDWKKEAGISTPTTPEVKPKLEPVVKGTEWKSDFVPETPETPEKENFKEWKQGYVDRAARNTIIENIPNNIASLEEEEASSYLNRMFQSVPERYQVLEFEETGMTGDWLIARNKISGKEITVSLDNMYDSADAKASKLLKAFIKESIDAIETDKLQQEINDLSTKYTQGEATLDEQLTLASKRVDLSKERAEQRQRMINDKDISAAYNMNGVIDDTYVNDITKTRLETSKLNSEIRDFKVWKKQWDDALADGRITQEYYDQEIAPQVENEKVKYSQVALKNKIAIYEASEKASDVEAIQLNRFEALKDRGNTLTGITNRFGYGVGSVFDLLVSASGYTTGDKSISDQFGEFMSTGAISSDYLQSEDRNILQQLLFSFSEVAGSTVTATALLAPIAPGVLTEKGAELGLKTLFTMSNRFGGFALGKNQMDIALQDANISEKDKALMSVIYGIGSAYLENFGLTKAFSSSPAGAAAKNWILGRTIKNLGKDITKESVDLATKKSIKQAIKEGIIDFGAAGIMEGSTEAAQTALEAGIKYVYNDIKGSDLVENYETFGDFMNATWDAAKVGIFGGVLTHGTGAVSRYAKNGFKSERATQNEAMIAAQMFTDPEMLKTAEARLSVQVMTGEKTQAQMDEELHDMRVFQSRFNKMSPDTKLEDTPEVHDLMLEKENLEAEIKGMDPAAAVAKKQRLDEVNNRITELSTPKTTQDAVKKPTEVPAQKETGTSKEVEGKTETTAATSAEEIEAKLANAGKALVKTKEDKAISKFEKKHGIDNYSDISDWLDSLNEEQSAQYLKLNEAQRNTSEYKKWHETLEELKAKKPETTAGEKVDYASSEIDRVKTLPVESEDGATMNLDGSKYEGGGLVIPLASKNMKSSELTRESIDAFIKENRSSIGADNVKVGVYKFPNSDQVSIDLNIVADPSMREQALKIGKDLGQESLFDLDTFENIKTGSDGMNPKTLTSEEFKSIQDQLTPESKFKSVFTGGLDSTLSYLDKLDNDLDNFGKENLSMGIPVVVAKAAVKAAKGAAQTAKLASEVVDAAVNAVRQSDWYQNLSDKDKVKAEQNAKRILDEGTAVAEKQAKKTKTTEPTKATKNMIVNKIVDTFKAIKSEEKARKEGAKFEKDVRKELGKIVTDILAKGGKKYNPRQVRSMVSKGMKMNLSNPIMAHRFADYVQKVANDALYNDKLAQANYDQKRVKNLGKVKDQQATLAAMAANFNRVDPRMVEDIDVYSDIALKAKAALTSTRAKGGDISYRDVENYDQIIEYTNKALERQERIKKDMMELQYPELFEGEDPVLKKDMSIAEMNNAINAQKEGSSEAKSVENEAKVREQAENVFKSLTELLSNVLNSGVDPFTNEEVNLSDGKKAAIKKILDLNTKDMNIKQVFGMIDMMNNLVNNGIFDNVENVASQIIGDSNMKTFAFKTGKADKLNAFSRSHGLYIKSLPVFLDDVFKSTRKAVDFLRDSGVSGIIQGRAKALTIASNTVNDFVKTFKKKKPNGKAFNDASNIYERGAVGFLSRGVVGTQTEIDAEFKRRIDLFNETVEYLTGDTSSSAEKTMGKLYKDIQTKLGTLDSNASLESIRSKADAINVEAVDWWVDKWSENYDAFETATRTIYNKNLPRDSRYLPDVHKRTSLNIGEDIDDILEMGNHKSNSADHIYNKSAGPLMNVSRPKTLTEKNGAIARYIDLDFDTNQSNLFESALTDIHTAASISQWKGFSTSSAWNQVFTPETGATVKTKVNNYIKRSRNADKVGELETRFWRKFSNTLANTGTAYALGGVSQTLKQTTPVIMNTLLNNNLDAITLINSMVAQGDGMKNMYQWIADSGMPIANRGKEALTSVRADKVNTRAKSFGDNVEKAINKAPEFYLKKFLEAPDRYVTISSFVTYYKKNLKRRGLDSNIDFSKPMDKEAAEYAQHMVDRAMNISDADLAGEFFASKNSTNVFIKRVFFPFANFIMNQKSRMAVDAKTLFSKTNSAQDKVVAIKSLGGMAAEMVTFHAIATLVRLGIRTAVNEMMGYDAASEDKAVIDEMNRLRKDPEYKGKSESEIKTAAIRNKMYDNSMNGFYKALVEDMISPMPASNSVTVGGMNYLLRKTGIGTMSKEDINKNVEEAKKKYEKTHYGRKMSSSEIEDYKSYLKETEAYQLWNFGNEGLGVFGVGYDRWKLTYDLEEAARTGEIWVENKQSGKLVKKYVLPKHIDDAKNFSIISLLHDMHGLPAEAGTASIYALRNLEKSALTEKQMAEYEQLKKLRDGKEPNEKDVRLIKEGNKAPKIYYRLNP